MIEILSSFLFAYFINKNNIENNYKYRQGDRL